MIGRRVCPGRVTTAACRFPVNSLFLREYAGKRPTAVMRLFFSRPASPRAVVAGPENSSFSSGVGGAGGVPHARLATSCPTVPRVRPDRPDRPGACSHVRPGLGRGCTPRRGRIAATARNVRAARLDSFVGACVGVPHRWSGCARPRPRMGRAGTTAGHPSDGEISWRRGEMDFETCRRTRATRARLDARPASEIAPPGPARDRPFNLLNHI